MCNNVCNCIVEPSAKIGGRLHQVQRADRTHTFQSYNQICRTTAVVIEKKPLEYHSNNHVLGSASFKVSSEESRIKMAISYYVQ
jgi:hypothetical protein